jgi:hypothetical protein
MRKFKVIPWLKSDFAGFAPTNDFGSESTQRNLLGIFSILYLKLLKKINNFFVSFRFSFQ